MEALRIAMPPPPSEAAAVVVAAAAAEAEAEGARAYAGGEGMLFTAPLFPTAPPPPDLKKLGLGGRGIEVISLSPS